MLLTSNVKRRIQPLGKGLLALQDTFFNAHFFCSETEEQPAFYHAYEYVRGNKLGILKLNPEVAERLSTDRLRETIHPRHLPMLVPPKPWMHVRQGGYLYNKCKQLYRLDS